MSFLRSGVDIPGTFRCSFCFFHDTAPPEFYPLSLHDALPISPASQHASSPGAAAAGPAPGPARGRGPEGSRTGPGDRKSTRLNSSHVEISYAVFCLKKKIRFWADIACD